MATAPRPLRSPGARPATSSASLDVTMQHLLRPASPLLVAALGAALVASSCRSDDLGSSRGPAPAPSKDRATAIEAAAAAPDAVGTTRVALAFPTGERATSALLLEKEMPAEVIKGKPFEYLLVVQNLTDAPLANVRLTDTVPVGLEVESRDPVADVAGELARWDLGTLAPRASKTVRVSAVASTSTDLETCATVEYESRLCATVKVVAPALDVVLVAPEEALAGDPLEVTVTVTNSGSGDARGVRVVEELPEGLTTASGQTRVVMDFGTLSSGASKSRTVELVAAGPGSYTHAASAEAGGGLSSTAEPVTTILREPRLALELTGDAEVRAGRPYAARAVVANTGDGRSEETTVRVALPAGVRAITFSEGGRELEGALEWSVGVLEPGASRALEMSLRATASGVLVTEAAATGRGAEAQAATLRTAVTGVSALGLEVGDESDLIVVGEEVTYRIVVENEGSAEDQQVVVSAEVEPGIEIVRAEGPVEATVEGRSVRFEPLAVLAPGETVELLVTVRSTVELDSRFQVSVVSASKTRPVTATESTNFVK